MDDTQILDALEKRAKKYGMKWVIQVDGCAILIRLEEPQDADHDSLRAGLLDGFAKEHQRNREALKKAESLPRLENGLPPSPPSLSFEN